MIRGPDLVWRVHRGLGWGGGGPWWRLVYRSPACSHTPSFSLKAASLPVRPNPRPHSQQGPQTRTPVCPALSERTPCAFTHCEGKEPDFAAQTQRPSVRQGHNRVSPREEDSLGPLPLCATMAGPGGPTPLPGRSAHSAPDVLTPHCPRHCPRQLHSWPSACGTTGLPIALGRRANGGHLRQTADSPSQSIHCQRPVRQAVGGSKGVGGGA